MNTNRISRRATSIGLIALLACVVGGAALFTELTSFSIGRHSTTVGSTALGVAVVNMTTKSPVPIVSFTSSNTAVATVPSQKMVSTTNGTAAINVTGVAPGCARITASWGGKSRSDDIVVHAVDNSSSLGLTVPDNYLILGVQNPATIDMKLNVSGTSGSRDLTINRATFNITSSNPNVATVPATRTQTSDHTSFSIYGKGDGCAVITVSTGTHSVSKTVRVIYPGG